MSMNVLMVQTAAIRFVLTLLEATLVPVILVIIWHLMDKCVMVSCFTAGQICELMLCIITSSRY